MAIQKNDFVEIEYTAKTDEGMVFDTTYKPVAETAGIMSPHQRYGPVIIMVGSTQIVPGLDKFIEGKEPGSYTATIIPEHAFGKKRPDLLKLIPRSLFAKQQIMPQPGLPVNIDGMQGIVKTASGGRCIVDFNHPLSGKTLIYDLNINRIVTDLKEKASSIIELQLRKEDFTIAVADDGLTITTTKKIPEPLQKLMEGMIIKNTGAKKAVFAEKKA